ncbi:MAG: UDP binding domain-containing protein, partial [bacterium]
WKAREFGINTRFIELAGEVNTAMPKWVISKVNDALNTAGSSVNGSRILVLGIAYKKNVDDMRESPSAVLIQLLLQKGAKVQYSDPHVPEFPKMREHYYDMQSIVLTADILQQFDLVLLATDHDAFDYDLIRRHAKIIVDTRGRYAMEPAPHIVPA